ncbi:hypothetical protein NQ318_002803 [Aromia moschata]|uniref:Uncharacterized protein n=1 Tax=Aromia moschata TaxID=1265417 RepID=A0AAV8XTK6_9CUCU|nr:hypothetical protein NQ318_002803 [Aromia moschata]
MNFAIALRDILFIIVRNKITKGQIWTVWRPNNAFFTWAVFSFVAFSFSENKIEIKITKTYV